MVAFFQVIIIQQPLPELGRILTGLLLVIFGLSLFVRGLEQGLFPIGESLAWAFAKRGNLSLLLTFAFALGFGTTIAEPALTAIAPEAATDAAEGGVIGHDESAMQNYATGLRITVALSVGLSILVEVLRIIRGWPIQHLIIGGYIGGYIGVIIMTAFAPPEIIGIAYDSGGVTFSKPSPRLAASTLTRAAELHSSLMSRMPLA